ncbi:MAG: hypothetical protein ABL917_01225 [Parcubacteria group bacterium]
MDFDNTEYLDKSKRKLSKLTKFLFIGWVICFSFTFFFLFLIEFNLIRIGGDGFGGIALIPFALLYCLVGSISLIIFGIQLYYLLIVKRYTDPKQLIFPKIVSGLCILTILYVLSIFYYEYAKEKNRVKIIYTIERAMTEDFNTGYKEYFSTKEFAKAYEDYINVLTKPHKIVSAWKSGTIFEYEMYIITDQGVQFESNYRMYNTSQDGYNLTSDSINKIYIGKRLIIKPPTREEYFKILRDTHHYAYSSMGILYKSGGLLIVKVPVDMYVEDTLLDYKLFTK